jgi:hypothetical protein
MNIALDLTEKHGSSSVIGDKGVTIQRVSSVKEAQFWLKEQLN